MKKWCQLNGILWKQYLIRNRIWFALFLVIGVFLAVFGSRQKEEPEYGGIRIGVFAEDESGNRLLFELQEEEGIFHFFAFDDKEEMIRQIENGSLECGFLLPEGFYENLENGKMMRQIELFYSPASSAHKISYEILFSHLFELLSDRVLTDYLDYAEESSMLTRQEAEESVENILKLKDHYAQNGSTFSFVYEQVGEEQRGEVQTLNTVKGCIAVIVFLMSLLGLAGCCETDGISWGLAKRDRIRIKEIGLNISVFGSVLLGGILLLLSGTGEGLKKEAINLLIYFIVLEIYIRIMKLIFRKAEAVYGLIPILVIGSLLFCPVFIQIKAYIPMAGLVEKFFPVSYYLNLP